ncbi:YncE family protein [Saccharolobus shibatae]|uniref:Uncharacterized protein n=1 Tax=Saccharolobus shibatae TaxID=2286 RepID=A0A8F5BVQ2_9CREN|nr:hypothetical protein [Saccharolobus shibatae]QXJ32322.1 hypothetical protein J5U21_01973 [Saccharolobus shibatae]QXJ35377.1 hypothetical protein J5U22_01924 [Saccharolobus shibatae]
MKMELEIHAYGMLHPGHMEWTPDGRLLVSEFGRGRVLDATKGGNMRDAIPFAYNLSHPAAILPHKDRILVADAGFNAILDITEGGDQSRPKVVAKISGPYGLAVYHNEIYATFSTQTESGIVKIGKNEEVIRHVTGFPVVPSMWSKIYKLISPCNKWETPPTADLDILIFGHGGLGKLYDASHGGDFNYLERSNVLVNGLSEPIGMIYNRHDKNLYVVESKGADVKSVSLEELKIARDTHEPIDLRLRAPIVSGFYEPRCVRFSDDGKIMYVCDIAAGVIWKVKI